MHMFGNAITDFTVHANDGTYGNIIAIDLKTNRIRKIVQVQLKSTAGPFSEVFTAPSSLSALYNYLEDANAPDVAFNQSDSTLSVFLKTTAFPIVSTNRIGVWFYRNVIPGTLLSSDVDAPDEYWNLGLWIFVKQLLNIKGKRVELFINNNINSAKRILQLN